MTDVESLRDDEPRLNAMGVPFPRTAWALVRNGVIAKIVHTYDHEHHPFGDIAQGEAEPEHGPVALTGEHVLRVDSSIAAVGDLVDAKGNTTPAEGRARPLIPGEAAYRGPTSAQIQPAEHEGGGAPEAADPERQDPDLPAGE
ncbi:hypothetical protein [Tanticharoenia sakaeratensis]|uniref:Uncharacterized protein n=1 Tax=Tanticharoenia sakaeratensis NBRC 103193 TaxID=1231623 RepID=A0A0D6MPF1_9PROT|nr:hypothetical protein [Tanticharoenia sakaeratensis]GAN55250.1 hypothetical protein Tasa_041_045 [Tanticharoenia sakaeratensis NBRC 103193]GBQ23354.1 hypothetical protein AA103193_2387 [Tanticharoenia sakaeratensis NBRC 103193]